MLISIVKNGAYGIQYKLVEVLVLGLWGVWGPCSTIMFTFRQTKTLLSMCFRVGDVSWVTNMGGLRNLDEPSTQLNMCLKFCVVRFVLQRYYEDNEFDEFLVAFQCHCWFAFAFFFFERFRVATLWFSYFRCSYPPPPIYSVYGPPFFDNDVNHV